MFKAMSAGVCLLNKEDFVSTLFTVIRATR